MCRPPFVALNWTFNPLNGSPPSPGTDPTVCSSLGPPLAVRHPFLASPHSLWVSGCQTRCCCPIGSGVGKPAHRCVFDPGSKHNSINTTGPAEVPCHTCCPFHRNRHPFPPARWRRGISVTRTGDCLPLTLGGRQPYPPAQTGYYFFYAPPVLVLFPAASC